jgi:hypothetical protein
MYNRPKGNPATSTAWSYGDDTAEDKEYPNYDVPQKKIEAFLEGMEKTNCFANNGRCTKIC